MLPTGLGYVGYREVSSIRAYVAHGLRVRWVLCSIFLSCVRGTRVEGTLITVYYLPSMYTLRTGLGYVSLLQTLPPRFQVCVAPAGPECPRCPGCHHG